jgi:hypothetical protein
MQLPLTSSLNSYLRVSTRSTSSAPYMRGWSCRQHKQQQQQRHQYACMVVSDAAAAAAVLALLLADDAVHISSPCWWGCHGCLLLPCCTALLYCLVVLPVCVCCNCVYCRCLAAPTDPCLLTQPALEVCRTACLVLSTFSAGHCCYNPCGCCCFAILYPDAPLVCPAGWRACKPHYALRSDLPLTPLVRCAMTACLLLSCVQRCLLQLLLLLLPCHPLTPLHL